MGNKYYSIDWPEEEICEKYKAGISTIILANTYNCTRRTITRLLRKNNIQIAKAGCRIGEKHHWKGGISKLTPLIRASDKYLMWRKSVYRRDRYTCQSCFTKINGMIAHHIVYFRKIISDNKITTFEQAMNCEFLWDIKNGKTLCYKCHDKLHGKKYL